MHKAIMAVITFVVILSVINIAVTGTSQAEELVVSLGPLLAGVGALVALIAGARLGRG